ncbi:MAG TPA: hypothetical protein VIX37_12135 [Candidatus Sulfotelmatobacter sp.]
MTPEKKRRVATAGIFLSGVLACLDAAKDSRIFWPPDVVWEGLRNPNRLKLGAGIALIVVSFATSVLKRRSASEQ